MDHYDLVVIGSGPAGQKGAINAAKLGRRVALVERLSCVGGHCVTSGTIPSKALREAVLHLTGYRNRYFQRVAEPPCASVDIRQLNARTRHVIECEMQIVADQMRRNGVRLYCADAAFTDPRRLRLGGAQPDEITADKFLIATGSRPHRPAEIPFTPGQIMDSDEILSLDHIPTSMLVVGGGVIGVEYACIFAVLGARVTLLDARPVLLEFIDDEIVLELTTAMTQAGINVRLGTDLAQLCVTDGGVRATMKDGATLLTEAAIIAAGRRANTESLNLPAAGVATDNRGRIRVDEYYQTSAPHISAAGDVIGFPALAATSMEQGRLATCYQNGLLTEHVSTLFPFGIYTIPEVSMVGQTQEELQKAGERHAVGIARYREIARGQLIGDTTGMLKLIFHPDSHRLLGVHIIGEGATELIHIGQAVMAAQMPVDYFVSSVFNYPTLAECYRVAALDGLNRLRKCETAHAFVL